MDEIVVRHAKESDDYFAIASCVYYTDPFIYPAAFGTDDQQAANAISKLMSIENGLFNLQHFVIAIHGEEICGILLYNKDGAVWDKCVCEDLVQGIAPSIENFGYVSDVYFSDESAIPPENHIKIIACCVMPGFRNLGIGNKLLSWIVHNYSQFNMELDVLADNATAIKLYSKFGFRICEEIKGFSMTEETRPDCFHMIRNRNDSENNERLHECL